MPAVYRNGQWVWDDESQAVVDQRQQFDPYSVLPKTVPEQMEEQRQQQVAQEEARWSDVQRGGDTRPFWAADAGQALSDTGKILANAGIAIGTDYLDLAAGVGDLATQSLRALSGQGWDWNQVMNDADNPWTAWRRDQFRTDSKAGQAVSNLVRMGTALIALPKVAAKGITIPLQAGKNLPAIGGALNGIGQLVTRLDDLVKVKPGAVQNAAEGIAKGFQKGTAAQKASSAVAANTWLAATYDDVARAVQKAPELSGFQEWMGNVRQGAKALNQLSRGSKGARIRTVGEALAWDAFVAFNVFGEGDAEMDETLADLIHSSGNPYLQALASPLTTTVEDSGLAIKAKQMVEGLLMAPIINGVIDTARVYRFSKQFRAASPADRAKILDAFNSVSGEIGASLGRQQLLLPPGKLSTDELLDRVTAARQMGEFDQAARARQAFQASGVGGPAQGPSPIPGMGGAAYDESMLRASGARTLGSTGEIVPAPGGALEPLTPGMEPVTVSEWQDPMLPGTGMNQGQLPGAGPGQLQLPGGPEAKPPGAPPAGLLGAGGGELIPPPQRVTVTDVTPRAPEPTVTPQTIKSAFERDAIRAWRQAQELTFEEGTDGVMRSLAKKIEQLMPRTRVDSIEYLQRFRPAMNEMGVISASDSVWMNFIYNKGVAEGWATIDPDTMGVMFNRAAAASYDRGEAVMKQAQALDEAVALQTFEQRFADRIAEIEGQKNQVLGEAEDLQYQQWLAGKEGENGLSMQPDVQQALGGMEQSQAAAGYDAWEAQQAAARAQDANAATDAYDAWEAQQDGKRLLQEEAVAAGQQVDQIDAFEAARLEQAARAVTNPVDDETVVRDMLGTGLDSVEPATIERAPTGRGWVVIDRNGEILGEARTKRAAQQIADRQSRMDREALINRARQMEADANDEAINVLPGSPVRDSDLMGKMSFTEPQIRAVRGVSPELDQMLDAAWLAQRGEGAWFNVNDLGKTKRTFELSQGQMDRLMAGIDDALQQAGDLKGSTRLKVLRNLRDKLDTQVKLMEPEARSKRFVDDLLGEAEQYGKHGEFCDPF